MVNKRVSHTVTDNIINPYTPYDSEELLEMRIPGYENYTLHFGLTSVVAEQLFIKSKKAHVANTTRDVIKRDGSPGRFSNKKNFEEWTKKGRLPFVLLDKEGDLSMIVWLGKEKLDEFTTSDPAHHLTYAIRRYEPHKRNPDEEKPDIKMGLTAAVSELVVDIVVTAYGKKNNVTPTVWLSTTSTNTAALALYTRTGWQEVGRKDLANGDHEVFMIHHTASEALNK